MKHIEGEGIGMEKIKAGLNSFGKAIAEFFGEFGEAVVKGDIFVKLSLLWMGAGYVRRKQYIKAMIFN